MPLIEDKYSDTVGRIRFPITSSLDYEAISIFYKITGAVPNQVEVRPDCVVHLVRLRSLPSLIPMELTTAPEYTVEFQTDSFEDGITRMVIQRDADMKCVVRYERSSDSGWGTFAFDKPRLRYFTD